MMRSKACVSFFLCLTLSGSAWAGGDHESTTKAAAVGFFHGLTHPLEYWAPKKDYYGSSFNGDWNVVRENPYEVLPHFEVLPNLIEVAKSAKRTINDRNDILPYFQKFIHADGVCLAGTWQIDGQSPYTGLFAPGSQALIIARASLAAGNPTQGHYRSLGIAGKLFNTKDPNQIVPTADFFTLNDGGGTLEPYFTKETFTNRPPVTVNDNVKANARLAAETTIALRAANSHVTERQLYEVSESGVAKKSAAKTPYLMKLEAAPGQDISKTDFRDELQGRKQLVFNISVKEKKDASWTPVGKIVFTKSTASVNCDHRLHFHHMAWRKDLP